MPFWKILLPPWVTISKDHPLNKNPRIQIILGPIKLNMITSNLQPQSHAQSIAPDQIQFATGVVNTVHHWFASTLGKGGVKFFALLEKIAPSVGESQKTTP